MAASVIVDASFLVTLISRRESNHRWSQEQGHRFPPPWKTCEAALSETFYLLGPRYGFGLATLLRRGAVVPAFHAGENISEVLTLMHKYADVPMSLADACLVRMTEILPDPILLTTDTDFRIYRRHGRQIVPCIIPD